MNIVNINVMKEMLKLIWLVLEYRDIFPASHLQLWPAREQCLFEFVRRSFLLAYDATPVSFTDTWSGYNRWTLFRDLGTILSYSYGIVKKKLVLIVFTDFNWFFREFPFRDSPYVYFDFFVSLIYLISRERLQALLDHPRYSTYR